MGREETKMSRREDLTKIFLCILDNEKFTTSKSGRDVLGY